MEEKRYAHKIQMENFSIEIIYHLNMYCVAIVKKTNKGTIMRIVRQYKTLRGAENYLLKDYPYAKRNTSEIEYATEKEIKERNKN